MKLHPNRMDRYPDGIDYHPDQMGHHPKRMMADPEYPACWEDEAIQGFCQLMMVKELNNFTFSGVIK